MSEDKILIQKLEGNRLLDISLDAAKVVFANKWGDRYRIEFTDRGIGVQLTRDTPGSSDQILVKPKFSNSIEIE